MRWKAAYANLIFQGNGPGAFSLRMPKREPEKAAFFTGKAAIGTRNFDASRRSRAARQSRAACAQSAQGKQKGRLKPNSFGFQPALLFPFARELACRRLPDTRKQSTFVAYQTSRKWVQGAGPLARGLGPRRPQRALPGNASSAAQAHASRAPKPGIH